VVTINNQLYGLYANVETVKKAMLARWFDDTGGSLFEATNVDFVAADLPLYDLESGPDDRSLIAGLNAALTLDSPDEAMSSAADYVDLPELLRFMAVCAVTAQLDSFPYSTPGDDIHLYSDPGSRRLVFMPWGMDETFYSAEFDVKNVSSVLAKTCLASPGCFTRWTEQILGGPGRGREDGDRRRTLRPPSR
jgi:spore coat protein CotH